ncbi:MAG TPA: MCP four helix bundle domain-containing protein, partial [Rhodopila sp.]|nr:MCP four helix bundle domain-containing protein [Rhodopila sp.]
MRTWRNWSISTKIASGMALAFISALALGLFGLWQTSDVNSNAASIRDNWLPSTVSLGRLGNAVADVRINEAGLIASVFSKDPARWKKDLAAFKESLEKADAAYAAYVPRIAVGTAEEDYMKSFRTEWAKYKSTTNLVVKIGSRGDGDTMLSLYLSDDKANFDKVVATVGADTEFNGEQGRKAADDGQATFEAARMVTIVAILACSLLCIGAAGAIILGVAHPMRKLAATVDRLAAGDFDSDIDGGDRKDEIGLLTRSLTVFRQNGITARQLGAEQAAEQAAKEVRTAKLADLVQGFEARIGTMVGTLASGST